MPTPNRVNSSVLIRTAGLVVSSLAVLAAVVGSACSSTTASDGLGATTTAPGTPVDSCATPSTGCSCPAEGAQIPCGDVALTSGSYVSCSMGKRTCTQGTWGACVGDHVVQKRLGVSTLALGTGGTTCGSANICDPYCSTIVDTPGGVDAGAGFTSSDAGLTLSTSAAATDGGLGSLPIPSVCLPACTGGAACVGGACVCPEYETMCGGTCKPTSVDPSNCGGCGVICTGALACSGGVCSSSCLPGLSACSNSCVDEQNDSNNCGSCGHVCGVGTGCAGGACAATIGTAACATKLTGTIMDPAKLRPVYGAQVFIPIVSPAPALVDGVACDTCAALFGSNQLLATSTAADGTFTLAGVPTGTSFPLVIQLGRWRRQVTVPAITNCATGTLSAAQAHLPARHLRTVATDEQTDLANPDLPLMAMITGVDDATECLLAHMGIATSEFTLPTGSGRIHMYAYDKSEGLQTAGNASWVAGYDPGATLSGGDAAGSTLFSTSTQLNNYSFVLAPRADVNGGPSTAMQNNMYNWLNTGGRLFTSHHGSEDWIMGQPGWGGLINFIPEPWTSQAADQNDRPSAGNPLLDNVNMSFPAGVAMASFVHSTWNTPGGPGGVVPALGVVPLPNARHDVTSVNAPTVAWLSGDSTSSGRSGAGPQTNIFSFDTPVGSANQCGRVVAPFMHVSGSSSGTFPSECGTVPGPLTGQELAFEFMLYESMACLQSVTAPPPVVVPPPSCAATALPAALGSGCDASLAQATFTSGLCSCAGFTVSSPLTVDSYNSANGPYASGGTSGSISTNGAIQSNAVIDDEGSLTSSGTGTGAINFVSSSFSTIKKNVTSGGNLAGHVNVSGNAALVGIATGGSVITGMTTHPASVSPPCDCAAADQVPVGAIVAAHAVVNDNALIGLTATSISSMTGTARLDLPCGNFYVNGFNNNGPLTIDAHGRTALYIQGDINANASISFTLEPGAEFDVFLSGNINTNSGFVLGSPNYPAMMRMYVGGSGTVNINSAGARLAGEWYNANGLLNLNTTTAQYGSLYTGGITLNSAFTLHVDTSVNSVGTNECGTAVVATPMTFSRDYTASCPAGNAVEWEFFEYEATIPTGTSIGFTAQTADTEAQLGGGPLIYPENNPPVTLATATTTATTPTSDPHTVAYHLTNDVMAAPQISKSWLRVNMTLNPAGGMSPTLTQWQQMYDCKPAQ